MKIGYYLARPNAERTSIDCVVSAGQRYKKGIGVTVEVKYWDRQRGMCREVKQYPEAQAINSKLKKIAYAVDKVATQLVGEFVAPTNVEFWRLVDLELTGGANGRKILFLDYFEEYVKRRSLKGSIMTLKKYRTALNKLREFERDEHRHYAFSDINLAFYNRLHSFFIRQGFSQNYFGAVIKCVKVVYRDARDVDGIHNLRETEKRGFTTISHPSKSVYLTQNELQRIADVEITAESITTHIPKYSDYSMLELERKVEVLNLARNKFIVGAYTALRVSDFNNLRSIHISDGFFRVTTHKTGAAVVIPIHPTIRKLIESGFDIGTPISEQKININIKEVARIAGITQPVEATKLINHRAVTDWWPKCDVITTHTARRSAATNMYKAGIPAISIMRITGHTTEKSFMKYICITNEENAELMARNAFFTGR